jgi:hypothetical protein
MPRNATDLDLIEDIRGGAKAIRQKSLKYLPQYEGEDRTEYVRRVNAAPWRPDFNDALLALASKLFSKAVTVRTLHRQRSRPSRKTWMAEETICIALREKPSWKRWRTGCI